MSNYHTDRTPGIVWI